MTIEFDHTPVIGQMVTAAIDGEVQIVDLQQSLYSVLGGDCMGTAAGVPTSQRRRYNNGGTDFAELGNHGWTLDPPRLTTGSDRGTGDALSPRTAVAPRHLNKANVIFCDAHVDTQ